MVWATVLLKFMVEPVMVYPFVKGVKTPSTPIVPVFASVRAPVDDEVKLL